MTQDLESITAGSDNEEYAPKSKPLARPKMMPKENISEEEEDPLKKPTDTDPDDETDPEEDDEGTQDEDDDDDGDDSTSGSTDPVDENELIQVQQKQETSLKAPINLAPKETSKIKPKEPKDPEKTDRSPFQQMVDFFMHGITGSKIKNGDLSIKARIADELLAGLGFRAVQKDVMVQRQAKRFWLNKLIGKEDLSLLNTDTKKTLQTLSKEDALLASVFKRKSEKNLFSSEESKKETIKKGRALLEKQTILETEQTHLKKEKQNNFPKQVQQERETIQKTIVRQEQQNTQERRTIEQIKTAENAIKSRQETIAKQEAQVTALRKADKESQTLSNEAKQKEALAIQSDKNAMQDQYMMIRQLQAQEQANIANMQAVSRAQAIALQLSTRAQVAEETHHHHQHMRPDNREHPHHNHNAPHAHKHGIHHASAEAKLVSLQPQRPHSLDNAGTQITRNDNEQQQQQQDIPQQQSNIQQQLEAAGQITRPEDQQNQPLATNTNNTNR